MDYFTEQILKKEVEALIGRLDPWLDQVYVVQNRKPAPEAEAFLRRLAEAVSKELERMIWDRKLDPLERKR